MITEPKMEVKYSSFQVIDKYINQENFTRKLLPRCREVGHLPSLGPFWGHWSNIVKTEASRTHRIVEHLSDLVRCD